MLKHLVKRIDVYKSNTFPIVEYYKKKGILMRLMVCLQLKIVSQEILKIIS